MNNKLKECGIHVILTALSNVMHISGKIGSRYVCINICPSAFGNTSFRHTIVCNFFVPHHYLTVHSLPRGSAIRTLRPKNTGANENGIFRNIHPHTEATAGIAVRYISEQFIIIYNIKIDKMCIPPTAAGSILSSIQCESK